MTRGESYLFLIKQCEIQIEFYQGEADRGVDIHLKKFYQDKTDEWQSALDLLNEEKKFHMDMLGDTTPTDKDIDAAQDEYEFNRIMDCSGIDEIANFPPGQGPLFIGMKPKKDDN